MSPWGYSVTAELSGKNWGRGEVWFSHHIWTKELKMGETPCLLHRPLAYGLWFPGCPDVPSRKDTSAIVLIMLCLQFLSRLIICWLPLAPDHKSVWENIPGMKTWNSSCENANPIAPPPVIIKAEGPLSRIKLLVWGR